MTDNAARRVLQIKKYPNRRFYDATRSCHVTADDLYRLICEGYEVVVTDSKSGADITNQVLTQMILERDPPKLDVFPAGVLHEVIRANQNLWQSFTEQLFGGAINAVAASQKQFGDYMRQAMNLGGRAIDPFGWTRNMLRAMNPGDATPVSAAQSPEAPAAPTGNGSDEVRANLNELRQQVADLTQQLGALKSRPKARARRRSKRS